MTLDVLCENRVVRKRTNPSSVGANMALGLPEPCLEVGPAFMMECNSKKKFELGFASQKTFGAIFLLRRVVVGRSARLQSYCTGQAYCPSCSAISRTLCQVPHEASKIVEKRV